MLLDYLILGSLALNAVVSLAPNILGLDKISHVALTSLGVVTDTRYWTLVPSALAPVIEITNVQEIEAPVPGTYPKLWVSIIQNAVGIRNIFVRIIDDDTDIVVGYKKNFITIGEGDSKVVKYDGLDDWSRVMPNRNWNLRIEVGTN